MLKSFAAFCFIGLLATSPAHGEEIANTLKTSHCAKFAKAFIGNRESVITRVSPLYNPGLPEDRFSVVMANPAGIPVVNPQGGFWAFSPPVELVDADARATYEIFARYGAWLVIQRTTTPVTESTELIADIFIHVPPAPQYANFPKCFRMNPFGILGAHLPPMDYATE